MKKEARGLHSIAYGHYSKALGQTYDAWPGCSLHRDHGDRGWSDWGAKKIGGRDCLRLKQNIHSNRGYNNSNTIDTNNRYERTYLLKIFSAIKPALVSWGKLPRGEPGEPRPTGLRTLSSQQKGATSLSYEPRFRNHNRGIRPPGRITQRKQQANHNKRLARSQTREYRTSTPLRRDETQPGPMCLELPF